MNNGNTTTGAGTQPVAGSPVPQGTQPGAANQPPVQAGQTTDGIDLTKIESFQKLQSKWDQRYASLEGQLANERAAREAAERRESQREEDELSQRDPAEQVAFYKQKRADEERMRRIAGQAVQMCQEAGVDFNDERLATVKGMGATEAMLGQMTMAVVRIARDDAQAQLAALKQQTGTNAQAGQSAADVEQKRAINAALIEAGVMDMSGNAATPNSEQPKDAVIEAFKARKAKLRGLGFENPAVKRFRSDLINAGLSGDDLR